MIAGLPVTAWVLILVSVVPAFLVALAYWVRNRPRRRPPSGARGDRGSGPGDEREGRA